MRDRNIQQLIFSLRFAVFFCLLIFSLQGCASDSNGSPAPETTTAAAAEVVTDPTDTPRPSPTSSPELAVLVAPPEADPEQKAALEMVMEDLALQDGMEFQSVADISQLEFNEALRIVTVLAPDPGVTELAAAHPDVQFLGVGIPGLPSTNNLSSIGADGERPDRQGFLAGYMAAVISDDWRIGVISPSETASGQASRLGFINGGIFYCGLCRPVYPPFIQYPQFAEIPSNAGDAEWQAAADTLIANAVKTVYVYPGIGGDGLLNYLAQAGLNIIGGMTPAAGVNDHWVASIQPDLPAALREIWPSLINGEGGQVLPIPITISDQNEQLFSPGRQGLVDKLLSELSLDYIDTGVDPLTGTLK